MTGRLILVGGDGELSLCCLVDDEVDCLLGDDNLQPGARPWVGFGLLGVGAE